MKKFIFLFLILTFTLILSAQAPYGVYVRFINNTTGTDYVGDTDGISFTAELLDFPGDIQTGPSGLCLVQQQDIGLGQQTFIQFDLLNFVNPYTPASNILVTIWDGTNVAGAGIVTYNKATDLDPAGGQMGWGEWQAGLGGDPIPVAPDVPLTYDITGTVLLDEVALAGVAIDFQPVLPLLKSRSSNPSKKAMRENSRATGIETDEFGVYTVPDLNNGTYTITPSLEGYTFDPVSFDALVSDASVSDVDFTATSTAGTGGGTALPPEVPTPIIVEPITIGGDPVTPGVTITPPAGGTVDVVVTVAQTPQTPGAPNADISFNLELTGATAGLTFSFILDYSGLSSVPTIILWWNGSAWVQPAEPIVWDWVLNTVSFNITFPMSGPRSGDVEVVLGDDDPLPVTLSSFTATPNVENQNISIDWTAQSESNMRGYHVYRSQGSYTQAYDVSGFIQALNNPFLYNYNYMDTEAEVETNYNYWLHSFGMDGSMMTWGPMSAMIEEIPVAVLPDATVLKGNHPNPFNPVTIISFDVKANEEAQLIIYNMKGQIVEKETFLPKVNGYQYTWNADKLASGVYFYKLQSNSYRQIKKMLLIK
jgi:type IX secretion system substrate protein